MKEIRIKTWDRPTDTERESNQRDIEALRLFGEIAWIHYRPGNAPGYIVVTMK